MLSKRFFLSQKTLATLEQEIERDPSNLDLLQARRHARQQLTLLGQEIAWQINLGLLEAADFLSPDLLQAKQQILRVSAGQFYPQSDYTFIGIQAVTDTIVTSRVGYRNFAFCLLPIFDGIVDIKECKDS